MTDRLFVYGTLAPGSDAWAVLEPWVVGEHRADSVAGRLYDTGRGYPGARFDPDPSTPGFVHGVVVSLDPVRAPDALIALDRYEGREYQRIVVRTASGVHVATYAWIAALDGCREVAGGRWAHRKQPETRPRSGR